VHACGTVGKGNGSQKERNSLLKLCVAMQTPAFVWTLVMKKEQTSLRAAGLKLWYCWYLRPLFFYQLFYIPPLYNMFCYIHTLQKNWGAWALGRRTPGLCPGSGLHLSTKTSNKTTSYFDDEVPKLKKKTYLCQNHLFK